MFGIIVFPYKWILAYERAKKQLYDDSLSHEDKEKAVHVLEQFADSGSTISAFLLGKHGATVSVVRRGIRKRRSGSNVTLALQNGVDLKTLSGLLGHYSAGFTLDTYGHITKAMKQDAADKVGSFLVGAVID